MRRHACAVLLAVLPLPSIAADNPSALKALRLLPKTEIQSLARIEAHDGTPVPERWHFLVHDPSSETGLREYVVAAGELVTVRSISQFAERVEETDVIENKGLKVDSDMLAQLAKNYAAVNDAAIDRISYQLVKEGEHAQPVWRLNCQDEAGKTIGTLVVTAAKGNVVSHEGFPIEPRVGPHRAALDFETDAEALVAAAAGTDAVTSSDAPKKKSSATARKSSSSKKRTASASRRASQKREVRRALPQERPIVVRRASRPFRNVLRNLFRF